MKCPRCHVDNSEKAYMCRACGMPLGRPSPGWASSPSPKPPEPERLEPPSLRASEDEEFMDVPEGVRYFDPPPARHSPVASVPVADRGPASPLIYASFWKRLAGAVIDGLILAIPFVFLAFTSEGPSELRYQLLFDVSSTVIIWIYFAALESSEIQATLGKRAMGIKVADLDGNPVSFGRATGRFWAKLISGLPLMIGYVMAGFTKRKQALHDMMVSTVVIRD